MVSPILSQLNASIGEAFGSHLCLPEYRQIELYTKRNTLSFLPEVSCRSDLAALTALSRSCLSFMLLEASFDHAFDGSDGKTSWQRYQSLPRKTQREKLVAEVYRILRVIRNVATHPNGHVNFENGIVKLGGTIGGLAIGLDITPAGLGLLDSFTAYALEANSAPYPEAYLEAMLSQYFTDIIAEIRRFADEDRVLYQFQKMQFFNRHFRFDCDNPKYSITADACHFDIGRYTDKVVYPIDFYLVVDVKLHIVPTEALDGNVLPFVDLPRWRARVADGVSLPASFKTRFGREAVLTGIPMT